MLAGPSRWGQAPGRSAAHGRSLAGPVDPVRIPPLALDPYLVEQRYHRQHLRIFGVSNFVILDACLSVRMSNRSISGHNSVVGRGTCQLVRLPRALAVLALGCCGRGGLCAPARSSDLLRAS